MSNILIMDMLCSKKLNADFKIQAFLSSEYAIPLFNALKALDTEVLHKSHIHGQGHIERVMLLGALISRAEKLTRHEENLVLFACSYHDIGRVDDRKDDLHGRRSAMMIVEKGLWQRFGEGSDDELAAVQAAICTHAVHDSMLDEIAAEFGVKEELMPLCKKVCFCLKDADNLDRVRLHDLEPKYLRHESSINMVSTAEYIFSEYDKEQKQLGL